MEELVTRLCNHLTGRIGEPMPFRLLLQPAMALIFAIRDVLLDGVKERETALLEAKKALLASSAKVTDLTISLSALTGLPEGARLESIPPEEKIETTSPMQNLQKQRPAAAYNPEIVETEEAVVIAKLVRAIAAGAQKTVMDVDRTRRILELTRKIVSMQRALPPRDQDTGPETKAALAKAEAEMFQAELDYRNDLRSNESRYKRSVAK